MSTPMDQDSDPTAQALWQQVLEDWPREAAHAAFIEHCRVSGRLDLAAQHYRGLDGPVGSVPADSVRLDVDRRIAAIAVLAVSALEASRAPAPKLVRCRTVLQLLAVVLLFSALVGLLAALTK